MEDFLYCILILLYDWSRRLKVCLLIKFVADRFAADRFVAGRHVAPCGSLVIPNSEPQKTRRISPRSSINQPSVDRSRLITINSPYYGHNSLPAVDIGHVWLVPSLLSSASWNTYYSRPLIHSLDGLRASRELFLSTLTTALLSAVHS
jgi:hypothetical protein